MSNEGQEMSLEEYVAVLRRILGQHRAVQEYDELQVKLAMALKVALTAADAIIGGPREPQPRREPEPAPQPEKLRRDPPRDPDPRPEPTSRDGIRHKYLGDGQHRFTAADEHAEWVWIVNSSPRWTRRPDGQWMRPGALSIKSLVWKGRSGNYPPLPEVGHPSWAPALLQHDADSPLPRIWLPNWSRHLDDSHGGPVVAPHYHWRLCTPDGVKLALEGMLRTWRYSGIMLLDDDGEGVTTLSTPYTWAWAMGPFDTINRKPDGTPVSVSTPTTGMPRSEGWQLAYGSRYELSHLLRQWRETEMMARVGCVFARWLLKQTWIDCLRWLHQPGFPNAQGAWRDWGQVRNEILSGPSGRGHPWADRSLYHLLLILRAFEKHWPNDPLLFIASGSKVSWCDEFRDMLSRIMRSNGTANSWTDIPPHFEVQAPAIRVWQQDLLATQYMWLGLHAEYGRYVAWRLEDGPTPSAVWSPTLQESRITEMTRSPILQAEYYDALHFERPDPIGPGGQDSISCEVPDAFPKFGLWGTR